MTGIECVDSHEELPQQQTIAYHGTDAGNVESILSSGIQSEMCIEAYDRVNQYLELVADETGVQCRPNSRAECVFAFPRFADAVDLGDKAVLAIDLEQVDGPIYRGSYHTVSQIYETLSKKKATTPETLHTLRNMDKSASEVYNCAVEYWNALVQTEPPIERGGELLIDTDVPVDAITAISGS